MSETGKYKKLVIADGVTGPGMADMLQSFRYLIVGGKRPERGQFVCIGYPSHLSPDSCELVCALPEREAHYAALIVTAANAFEPMKKALDDLLNQVIHWGDDSQLEAIAAEIKAAEAALRLAEGEKG